MLNCFHPKPVASVYERCSSLGLLHEIAKEMRLIRVVQALNAPLRDNTAAIGLFIVSHKTCISVEGLFSYTNNAFILLQRLQLGFYLSLFHDLAA